MVRGAGVVLPAAVTASNCIGPSISSDGANSLAISVASLTLSIIGPVLLSPVA